MKTSTVMLSTVVLHSAPKPGTGTTYSSLMVECSPDNIENRWFSWREALFGTYDHLHVHWPEALFRTGGKARRLVQAALGCALIMRLRISKRSVIRTVHNPEPHEEVSSLVRALIKNLDSATSKYVILNRHSLTPTVRETHLIPHPSYVAAFADYDRKTAVKGHVISFGLLRKYKGIEELIDAAATLPSHGPTLTIMGSATPKYAQELESYARGKGVSLLLRRFSDAELVDGVTSSEIVVLPYQKMHNSGAVFAALSLDRPVLIPDNEINRDLQAEVGSRWVHLYRGKLQPHHLEEALSKVRALPEISAPDLSRRSVSQLKRAYLELYSG